MNKISRNSNIEFLRIISMCGIISLHYFQAGLGGMVQNTSLFSVSWFFTQTISSFAMPLVNCFVLITGYFLVSTNTFKVRKIIDILIMTAFYGIIAYAIGFAFTGNGFSFKELFYQIVPFFKGLRWFVQAYVILIAFAPFMNKMLGTLTKKQYRVLLIIQLLLFSVWYSIGFNAPITDNGYGIINFITLYMLGGYLRLHFNTDKLFNHSKYLFLAIYFVSCALTFIIGIKRYTFGYPFVTNIIGACAMFVFFVKLPKKQSKLINSLSKATFDVYFVHSDIYTSHLIFWYILGGKFVSDTILMVPHLIIILPIIWAIGYIMFLIRSVLFKFINKYIIDKVPFFNYELKLNSHSE